MSEKYIELKTFCPNMAALHGRKKEPIDKLIQLRSQDTHTEIKFSDRYGGISWSATMKDDCNCYRFKMIGYTHPERWKTVRIPVTPEQEAKMFAKALEMSGYDETFMKNMGFPERRPLEDVAKCVSFGPNAIPYDKWGVSFAFVSKARIITGSPNKVWCTEGCFIVLIVDFPHLLIFDEPQCWDQRVLKPDDLTPTMGDEIARNYFR